MSDQNHCAIQLKVPMTFHSWKRAGRPKNAMSEHKHCVYCGISSDAGGLVGAKCLGAGNPLEPNTVGDKPHAYLNDTVPCPATPPDAKAGAGPFDAQTLLRSEEVEVIDEKRFERLYGQLPDYFSERATFTFVRAAFKFLDYRSEEWGEHQELVVELAEILERAYKAGLAAHAVVGQGSDALRSLREKQVIDALNATSYEYGDFAPECGSHSSTWVKRFTIALNAQLAALVPVSCPKCGGELRHGGHGAWCPEPTCKWGWETEMDGSPLKAAPVSGKDKE